MEDVGASGEPVEGRAVDVMREEQRGEARDGDGARIDGCLVVEIAGQGQSGEGLDGVWAGLAREFAEPVIEIVFHSRATQQQGGGINGEAHGV